MHIDNIALGTDIVDVARIQSLIKRFGVPFLKKIFTDDEIAYCQRTATPALSFAARFAAKEAFSKALGTGIGAIISWKDVSIGKKATGEPFLVLSHKAQTATQTMGVLGAKVSLSHTKTLAQATVLLMKR